MTIPTYDVDLYGDDALAEPYDHYRRLRDLGSVVWLGAHDVFAVSRFGDVRMVLQQPKIFSSGQGVGLNEFINMGGRGTTLMSDGELHRCQREVIGQPLTPRALSDLRPEVQILSEKLADRLVAARTCDAVTDLAEVLPSTWVPDLLGWPSEGRERLLDWASATFDGLGPLNDRAVSAGRGIIELTAYAQQVAGSAVPQGSMAAGILHARDSGVIEANQCPMLLIDYLAPSLDTTVAAIGNAMWLFATNPDQWTLLRKEPDRLKQAFNEVLRVESPISGFTRVTTESVTIDGVEIPADARVLVSFASANRDERYWENPEEFDITRNSAAHVAFGYGEHACVGMGLARLEGSAVLSALLERVERIELASAPVRKLNNLIRSFASLPVTLHSA